MFIYIVLFINQDFVSFWFIALRETNVEMILSRRSSFIHLQVQWNSVILLFSRRWNWLLHIFKGLNTAVVHNMSTNFLYHLQIVHLQSSVLVKIYFAKLLQNVLHLCILCLVTIYRRILFSENVPCLKYKYQEIIIREKIIR